MSRKRALERFAHAACFGRAAQLLFDPSVISRDLPLWTSGAVDQVRAVGEEGVGKRHVEPGQTHRELVTVSFLLVISRTVQLRNLIQLLRIRAQSVLLGRAEHPGQFAHGELFALSGPCGAVLPLFVEVL
jgi:hypothetical protein